MAQSSLESVRVLDLSSPVGTYCGRLLASLGADVVLVEPPEGDPYRRQGPYDNRVDGPDASLSFGYYQAGKRSIVLDLGVEDDLEALRALGASSDVVLISPSPERPLSGFDAETGTLAWAGDGTVVCSITPFGVTGPYSRRSATHLTSFAQSGQMCRTGLPGEPPRAQPPNIHWHLAGTHGAIAVMAALGVRDVLGGQFIDISAQEVEVYHDGQFEAYHALGLRPGGRTIGIAAPPSGRWDCADGQLDVAAYADRHWASFLEMLGHPDELTEPALADMALRLQIHDGLIATIEPLMAERSRHELFDRGQAAGLPVSLVNTPAEFVADEQLAARGFWVDLGRDETGPLRAPGPPALTTPSLFSVPRPAPRLGEHSEELRSESPRAQSASGGGDRAKRAPLEGVRVLSFGAFIAGNITAQVLAALGAEVVKLESRSHPEVLRNATYNYFRELRAEPSGVPNTPMYADLSKGMLGVAIEMANADGRAAFRELLRNSDILIENFGAGVMAKWGCTFEELRAVKSERLVMASLSGYGRTGPRASYLAYASSISAFTGLNRVWNVSGTYTDYVTGTQAALSLLAALGHSRATGESVYVDACQTEAFAALAASLYLDPLVNGVDTQWELNSSEGSLFTHVFACAGEDRWAAVEAVTLDQWNMICRVVERPEMVADSEAEASAARQELAAAVDAWAAPRTPLTVTQLLSLEGVPAAPVADNEESYHDLQLNSRGFPVHVEHPDLGWYVTANSPYRMSKSPTGFDGMGPRLGENTRDVLGRWAGMDDSAIEALISSGAVFDAGSV